MSIFRSQTQIRAIQSYIQKSYFYKILNQIPDKIELIMKHVSLECYLPNQTVFKYREVGAQMYLVLKGELFILIPYNEHFENDKQKMQRNSKLNQEFRPQESKFGEVGI